MRVYVAAHTGLPTLVTGAVPAGMRYRITGTAPGAGEWLVAEGLGMGTVVAVSDPAAPLDVETTWTVTTPAGAESASLTRAIPGRSLVDTLLAHEDGRDGITATWEGDAEQVIDPRAEYAQPMSSRWSIQTRMPTPAGPAWSMRVRLEHQQVRSARRIFESGRVWVVHSHARCSPACTLPLVMLCGVEGTVSEESWPLGRGYEAKLRQLAARASGVPVVTWGEASAARARWGPGTSFASIRAMIAGE